MKGLFLFMAGVVAVLIFAIVFVLWSLRPVEAAGRVCGERAKMTKFLMKRYKETPRAMGVASSGKSVMEIYTSDKGSWTVLMTTAKGVTCIMGAGRDWQESSKMATGPKT